MVLLRYSIFIIFTIYVAGCSSNNVRKEDLPEDMFTIIYGSDNIKSMKENKMRFLEI